MALFSSIVPEGVHAIGGANDTVVACRPFRLAAFAACNIAWGNRCMSMGLPSVALQKNGVGA